MISPKHFINKNDYNTKQEYDTLYVKLYRELNRDISNERARKYNKTIICECGASVKKNCKKAHLVSNMHKRYIKYSDDEELLNLLREKENLYNSFRSTGDTNYKNAYQRLSCSIRQKYPL